MMNIYYPFPYNPKKKETLDPLPLYIEIEPQIKEKQEKEEKEERGFIIIEL